MTPPVDSKGAAIDKILEAVRIGGWYDANPDQREPNYMDVDVAKQRINEQVLEWMDTLEVEEEWRGELKQEYLKEFE